MKSPSPIVDKTKVFALNTDEHRRMVVSVVCTHCGAAEERRCSQANMPPGVVAKWFKHMGWKINTKYTQAKCPDCVAGSPSSEVPVVVGPASRPVPPEPEPPAPLRVAEPEVGAGGVTPRVVTMTPLWALELLDHNTRNRSLSWAHAESLAHDMRKNDFKLNGDAIRIAKSGAVLDGQHRLQACILADKSFPTLLVTGLDDDVFDTIDVGRRRNAGDVLSIEGEKNARVIAAALRLLNDILTGNLQARTSTRLQVRAWLAAHPEIRDSVATVNKYRPVFRSHALAVVLHYVLSRIPDSDADWFMLSLISGANLSSDDYVYLLRNRLLEQGPRSRGTRRDRPAEIVALTLRCWEKWKAGARASKLQPPKRSPVQVVEDFLREHSLKGMKVP
jgi:hypothetical protein